MSDKTERTKEEILNDLILVNTRLHRDDVILEMFTSIPPEGCKQIILAAMEEYASQKDARKWISVKERLPEKSNIYSFEGKQRPVLAANEDGEMDVVTYISFGFPLIGGKPVVLWQPLPELPPIEEPK